MHHTSLLRVTRTWKVDLYGDYGDGPSARVYLGSHTVTLTASGDQITGEVDGQATSEQEACRLLNRAKRDGRVTLLSEQRAEQRTAA